MWGGVIMARILFIGDLHEPFTHQRYLSFAKKVYKQYGCNRVVFAGDMIDNHAISYWETDPDLHSAGDELKMAKKHIHRWYKAFPRASICIGNHDKLTYRKAKTAGITRYHMRDYNEVYKTPTWNWRESFIIDGVLYMHGKGSGVNAALKKAISEMQSLCMGHLHSQSGVKYYASRKHRIFALDSGCGIDIKSRAFYYADDFIARPILSVAVIQNGVLPIVVPMILGAK